MTMDSLPAPLLRPAARASQHGLDVVTVRAGTGETTQLFTIHKNLLCQSSSFFKSTFNGRFAESESSYLELKAVDPLTFEVLYQWLYTGSMRDIPGFAAESNVDIGLLWLRVFTMAHEYMIDQLQESSYHFFRRAFHDCQRVVPSVLCVSELYQSELPTHLVDMLQSYLVLHCAYWIMHESCNCWEWETVLKHPHFGADVAWELTKRGSKDYVGVQSHPWYNVKFANHNGRVFLKKDMDDEPGLREPESSDGEDFSELYSPASQVGEDNENGAEAASDD
ncbi:hypothetical protein EPUS_06598 [Endocarpon pusillum Z07020]|uniref:BTB domain-containing protein n=1 Tax=Endocarpon pusillum (strain Z07020 / HMAS-L-300199) TaxID=1263415 RepID=U1HUT3_ENDPU|nr:uncharacterized protein EPUS_06598 [Endocarpon pusillum Z07020]ERF74420.1 hypothetical protein EPUS_06598 [Endocarpon pusillum Z07020]